MESVYGDPLRLFVISSPDLEFQMETEMTGNSVPAHFLLSHENFLQKTTSERVLQEQERGESLP